jgi:hypothetical protein
MNKKYINTFAFILILLPSLAAQACDFNASMIENWSDKTVCRLMQENHANCSPLIDSELTSREMTCGKKGSIKKKQTVSDHSIAVIQIVDPKSKETPTPSDTSQPDNAITKKTPTPSDTPQPDDAIAKKTPTPSDTSQPDNAITKKVKQQSTTDHEKRKAPNKNTSATHDNDDEHIIYILAFIAFALILYRVSKSLFGLLSIILLSYLFGWFWLIVIIPAWILNMLFQGSSDDGNTDSESGD